MSLLNYQYFQKNFKTSQYRISTCKRKILVRKAQKDDFIPEKPDKQQQIYNQQQIYSNTPFWNNKSSSYYQNNKSDNQDNSKYSYEEEYYDQDFMNQSVQSQLMDVAQRSSNYFWEIEQANDQSKVQKMKVLPSNLIRLPGVLGKRFKTFLGQLRYNYYIWRKNIFADLLILISFNVVLVSSGVIAKRELIDKQQGPLWADLYDILTMTIGQYFPDSDDISYQVFGVVMVGIGVVAFALVLAVVEQLMMDILETNVKQGSRVYEENHYVILASCQSQADVEYLTKILEQLCLAHKIDDGLTIVALTCREKLEMEHMYKQLIPENRRFGSHLVFRKGDPLQIENLREVAVHASKAVIVLSDYSRDPLQSDAYGTRVAVMIDEMFNTQSCYGTQLSQDQLSMLQTDQTSNGQAQPYVVMQCRTRNALQTIYYSCSPRVLPMPTTQLKARYLVNILGNPIIVPVTKLIWNFRSQWIYTMHQFEELKGTKFKDLNFYFPDAIILGIQQHETDLVIYMPDYDYELQESDEIFLLRSSEIQYNNYKPLEKPINIGAKLGQIGSEKERIEVSQQASKTKIEEQNQQLKQQQQQQRQNNKTQDLMYDEARNNKSFNGGSASNRSSSSNGSLQGQLDKVVQEANKNIIQSSEDSNPKGDGKDGGEQPENYWQYMYGNYMNLFQQEVQVKKDNAGYEVGINGFDHLYSNGSNRMYMLPQVLYKQNNANLRYVNNKCVSVAEEPGHIKQHGNEVIENTQKSIKILIIGWVSMNLMYDLIVEFDRGQHALPPGSTIYFLNNHSRRKSLSIVTDNLELYHIKCEHLKGDPLLKRSFDQYDLKDIRYAIIMCDISWSQELNLSSNQQTTLRMDSLLMQTQLNLRRSLELRYNKPNINIITEKVAFSGFTRYEDRRKKPKKLSVNLSAQVGRMLAQVAYNPRIYYPYFMIDEQLDFKAVHASFLAQQDELVSYWELIIRAQSHEMILMGFYHVADEDKPIEFFLSMQGDKERSQLQVWNSDKAATVFLIAKKRSKKVEEAQRATKSMEERQTHQQKDDGNDQGFQDTQAYNGAHAKKSQTNEMDLITNLP